MTRKIIQVAVGEELKKGEPVAFKAVKSKPEKVKLVSYTIKATIPTGPYANVCPEITVQASSIEAAERAVLPYIEKMYATYLGGVPKNVEAPVVTKVETPAPKPVQEAPKAEIKAPEPKVEATTLPVPPAPEAKVSAPIAPIQQATTHEQTAEEKMLAEGSEPFKKAYNALKSNKTTFGIDAIMDRVRLSKTLTEKERDILLIMGLDMQAQLENATRRV